MNSELKEGILLKAQKLELEYEMLCSYQDDFRHVGIKSEVEKIENEKNVLLEKILKLKQLYEWI